MDSPTNLEDWKAWVASGRINRELAGEPPQLWGVEFHSWNVLGVCSQQHIWQPNSDCDDSKGPWECFSWRLWLAGYLVQMDYREWPQGKETHSQHWLSITFPGDCLKSSQEKALVFQQAAEKSAWESSWASYWQPVLLQMNWQRKGQRNPHLESWTEAGRLRGGRQDAERETEWTLLSSVIC